MSGVCASAIWEYGIRRTMTAQFQIDNISHWNVNNAEKPLMTFLELSMVKNLNGNDG